MAGACALLAEPTRPCLPGAEFQARWTETILAARRLTRGRRSSYSGHMKTATITEAKNQLSALIDRVRHGETIIITDRGRPVARLVSALTGAAADPEGRLARLERRGGLRRATAPPPRALIRRKLPNLKKPSGVLGALLEERREGR